ncbi:hypothetical protein [Mucilaginibacter sp. dw_454]|uniref:hypothetical protein n=1 Tax=Mucilaginibacter sp. dw_454 TaxID=2720079 RepID=UPI001BD3453D|nr:hypothetical protein [Mucilaginibacter sp. dw_454]
MGTLLDFETVFPNEKPLRIEEYLKGGSKASILNVAVSLLGFKSHDSKYNDNKELLNLFFGPENQGLSYHLDLKIKELEKQGKVGMINAYSSLKLFEYFFKRPAEKERQTKAEFEVNFFKAYLVVNSERTAKQHKAFDSTQNLPKELVLPMKIFCMNYPMSDIHYYDIKEIWLTQLFKATLLFQFLELNAKTSMLFNAFLKYFDVKNWQEYLKSFIPLSFTMIQVGNEGHTDFTVTKNETYEKSCVFLDKLIIEETEDLEEYDFLTLRSRPFYKISDGVYRIIFNLFVAEKIYKGMYFLLRSVNNTLPDDQKVKNLKSVIGNDFSEQVILYHVVEVIYPEKCIKFSGDHIANKKIKGGPDYYVRKYNDVLLFESKDFLIPADAKTSFDFARYQDEFEKKLYFEVIDGKEKHVGIMQLINFIKKLLSKGFDLDTSYDYRKISIYPIIVVHDHQYNVPGLNSLINYWFQAEIDILKKEGFYTTHIKPLVIINIDSLIFHQVGLTESIPLHQVLNKFANHIKIDSHLKFRNQKEGNDYILSKQVPFSAFIDEHFHNLGLNKRPPVLKMVAPEIFKYDQIGDNDNDES